jgi:S1-C subfamily serine protease
VNGLDWVLLVLALAYALAGYRQGFIVGAMSTAGLLVGGYLGVLLAPVLLDRFDPSVAVSLGALVLVLVCASCGQAVGAFAGISLRSRITWRPVRSLDAIGGAALSAAAALLVAWALGVAVTGTQLTSLGQSVRTSTVLSTVDRLLPGDADNALQTFNDVVDTSFFPRYLEPFAQERIQQVAPPDAAVAADPQVARAGASVVKIVGDADRCGQSLEGSGFVYAPGRVMTNAHVVAGIANPVVESAGQSFDAETVVYDPEHDVAVLAVDGLDARPLRFDTGGAAREAGAVLGYPENGPYRVAAARIREDLRLHSPDIYGDGDVYRDVFSVFVQVRPGNSGGPLVSRSGRVLGVVFAASVTDSRTGYALTAEQVSPVAAAGRTATAEVDTGDCA